MHKLCVHFDRGDGVDFLVKFWHILLTLEGGDSKVTSFMDSP